MLVKNVAPLSLKIIPFAGNATEKQKDNLPFCDKIRRILVIRLLNYLEMSV
jgi:hypothetical protein